MFILEIQNLDESKTSDIKDWLTIFHQIRSPQKRKLWNQDNPFKPEWLIYIKTLYANGYGLKVLARTFGVSYTKIRRLFQIQWEIPINPGLRVPCSDKTREFRKKKAKEDPRNPFRGWLDTQRRPKTKHGVQGYFLNKFNDYIWIRSTYEYIFIKWLEENNIEYKYEDKIFILSTGENYRPDFFLPNNMIIEIKGSYYNNRLYKTEIFKKEYPGYRLIIIDDILMYTKKSYMTELREWKNVRILEK